MKDLKDKVAVITGGAGEIGYATAQVLLSYGAKVLLVDLEEKALKERIKDGDTKDLDYAVADVTDEKQVEGYFKTAEKKFGKVDIFHNNAGIEGPVAKMPDFKLEDFEKVMAVNVTGVFLGMKYAPAYMNDGGSIIISSSVAGLQATPGMVGYVTSKHAVIGIMRTAALELAPRKIRVNSIHPGVIDSRMMNAIESGLGDDAAAVHKDFEEQVPLKRYGKEEEMAKLVAFLASDMSSYTTGSTYVADGGISL
ncbi:oxidoreductase [Nonlabens sp. YIK11]|uniref:SDR family NAD(P)-dependent oxidoreductase n=1 Tax=Nonlabens sp. YIK11 TaxID=1453349 RepID=UPI0006DD10CA|nr:SDR family NAD(P)-dependent oxidoreductase [Nonlabens sp. YIK11]KQC33724.1 oxidoreductase [Nonlabens sp. YIK11]